jgi:polyphosphate kinase
MANRKHLSKLAISPLNLRARILEHIEAEINHAAPAGRRRYG